MYFDESKILILISIVNIQKPFDCLWCEVFTHQTANCRKMKQAKAEMPLVDDNAPLVDDVKVTGDQLVIQLEAVVADTPVDAAYPAANRFQTRGPLDWWADSAATRHMTYDRGSLHNYKPINNPWTVTGIKNAVATVHGIGDVHLTTKVIYSMCSHKSDLILTYIYYFPDWANPNIAKRNLRPRTGNKP